MRLEQEILKQLNWEMNITMPICYIRFISFFGILFQDDETQGNPRELNLNLTKYISIFVDLASYYP